MLSLEFNWEVTVYFLYLDIVLTAASFDWLVIEANVQCNILELFFYYQSLWLLMHQRVHVLLLFFSRTNPSSQMQCWRSFLAQKKVSILVINLGHFLFFFKLHESLIIYIISFFLEIYLFFLFSGRLITGLVREFLEFFSLDYTLAVFDPEVGITVNLFFSNSLSTMYALKYCQWALTPLHVYWNRIIQTSSSILNIFSGDDPNST